jgi:hypothetical protein
VHTATIRLSFESAAHSIILIRATFRQTLRGEVTTSNMNCGSPTNAWETLVGSIQPEDDFSKGMQTIERAIIDGVWKAGRHVTTADFTWHRGRAVMPRPDITDLQLIIGRRAVFGIFSRQEIEDSAYRVYRAETLQTIQRMIAEASQLP